MSVDVPNEYDLNPWSDWYTSGDQGWENRDAQRVVFDPETEEEQAA